MNDTSCLFELIEQTHTDSHNKLSVSELCAIAGVSRSGYYAWLKAAPTRAAKEEQDRKDFDLILSKAGDNILLGSSKLDITQDVINGLNKRYKPAAKNAAETKKTEDKK